MNSQQKVPLAQRAARYVGMEDKPRRSLSLRPGVVLVIWDDGYGLVYSEVVSATGAVTTKHGEWFRLTPRRLATLRSILDDLDPRNLA